MNFRQSVQHSNYQIVADAPEKVCDILIDRIAKRQTSLSIGYINAYALWLARKLHFKKELCSQTITLCDGIGASLVFWGASGTWLQKCTPASFFKSFLRKLEEKKLKVFIYGHTKDQLLIIKEKFKSLYPNINMIEMHDGYGTSQAEVCHRIEATQPDIVLVALGMPLQEAFLADNKHRLQDYPLFAIGGTLLYSLNIKKEAPYLLRRLGVEWLWRWVHEPKRLTKRYIFGNSYVILLTVLLFFKRILNVKQRS